MNTLDNLPIWLQEPDFSQDPQPVAASRVEGERLAQTYRQYKIVDSRPQYSFKRLDTFVNREEIDAFLTRWAESQGGLYSFWAPSWVPEINPVLDLAGGTYTITADADITALGRRAVFVYYLDIPAMFVSEIDTVEGNVIKLKEALPFSASHERVTIGFLYKVTMPDRVELDFTAPYEAASTAIDLVEDPGWVVTENTPVVPIVIVPVEGTEPTVTIDVPVQVIVEATFAITANVVPKPGYDITEVEFFVSTNNVDFTSMGVGVLDSATGLWTIPAICTIEGGYAYKVTATNSIGKTASAQAGTVAIVRNYPPLFVVNPLYPSAAYDVDKVTLTASAVCSNPIIKGQVYKGDVHPGIETVAQLDPSLKVAEVAGPGPWTFTIDQPNVGTLHCYVVAIDSQGWAALSGQVFLETRVTTSGLLMVTSGDQVSVSIRTTGPTPGISAIYEGDKPAGPLTELPPGAITQGVGDYWSHPIAMPAAGIHKYYAVTVTANGKFVLSNYQELYI